MSFFQAFNLTLFSWTNSGCNSSSKSKVVFFTLKLGNFKEYEIGFSFSQKLCIENHKMSKI